jgi:hypothetical protein
MRCIFDIKNTAISILLFFPLALSSQTELTITDEIKTYDSLSNSIVSMFGKSELHITNGTNPLPGSEINQYSEDAWLFFVRIEPSKVAADYLNQVKVFDQEAIPGQSVRVEQYLSGTVVIPHAPEYKALEVFEDSLYAGASMELGNYDYYRGSDLLSSMNDRISSFKLKRGYMATFAENNDGTGFSKVYVAQDGDIEIELLPSELNEQVSFVRVFPWRWTHKKGYCGGDISHADTLHCAWRYDWDNVAPSTLDVEYVPMRHNRYWNSYDNINNKTNCTHVLGFNEPDRPDPQADMTVSVALAEWPNLLRSGLRLGSPAPADNGLSWLYDFIDQADAKNYRVDFVAVHFYRSGYTASSFYNWLKDIHERTGRPLWITEWNNGANWTGNDPTYEQQATTIASFINMLDTTSFVERYSIYNWVGDTRKVIANDNTLELTPAGIVYRDQQSPMAYSDPRTIPDTPGTLSTTAVSSRQIDLSWTDNAGNETGYKVERKTGSESFTPISRLAANATHYSDQDLLPVTLYSYRVVAFNALGDSRYSNIASDTTLAGFGVLPHTDWILHFVDSEEKTGEDGAAVNAFDDNTNTFWHTEWYSSNPGYPHEIQINLNHHYTIGGFLYLPRQDGNLNGTIDEYEFYISQDGLHWGAAVASGSWARNSTEKEVEFDPVVGKYIRLVAKSEVNNNAWASVAELNLLITGVAEVKDEKTKEDIIPGTYTLLQNYPNPFNSETRIRFKLPQQARVSLSIFDVTGKKIKALLSQTQPAGEHSVIWDGTNDAGIPVGSGIYLYQFQADTYSENRKMLLIK